MATLDQDFCVLEASYGSEFSWILISAGYVGRLSAGGGTDLDPIDDARVEDQLAGDGQAAAISAKRPLLKSSMA
jgi:hypothetical protein